jgi:hypothetical protein
MAKLVGTCLAFVLAAGATGGASSSSGQPPLHRECPPGNKRTPYPPATFGAALVQAKRVLYGQRANIQGQTYIYGPRNTQLFAAMQVQDLALVPGHGALVQDDATSLRLAHSLSGVGVRLQRADHCCQQLCALLRGARPTWLVRVLAHEGDQKFTRIVFKRPR